MSPMWRCPNCDEPVHTRKAMDEHVCTPQNESGGEVGRLLRQIEDAIKYAAQLGGAAFDAVDGRGLYHMRLDIREAVTDLRSRLAEVEGKLARANDAIRFLTDEANEAKEQAHTAEQRVAELESALAIADDLWLEKGRRLAELEKLLRQTASVRFSRRSEHSPTGVVWSFDGESWFATFEEALNAALSPSTTQGTT